MTHRSPSSTIQLLQCLQIRDELLVKPFNSLSLLSRAQRRQGYQIPGPLEYRRRAAKRRHGAIAATSAGALPLQDFGTLFGFKLTEAPRPDFEGSWRWEAPVHGAAALQPRQKDNGDWRPWMRALARPLPDSAQETRLAQFLDVTEDPIDASRTEFGDLLNAHGIGETLNEEKLRVALDFLQSPRNEPEAQLTLHLVQWLALRELTTNCGKELAVLLAQKLTLGTMSEEEGVAVLMEVLRRSDALHLTTLILDSIPTSRLISVSDSVTAEILLDTVENRDRLYVWLHALRSSAFAARSPHNTSKIWAAVYRRLAPHYRISDMTQHFQSVDERDFAMVVMKHWVQHCLPKDIAPSTIPSDIEFKENPAGWINGQWHSRRSPNFALGDLVGTLATHDIPYDVVLEEVVAYWEKTLAPETMLRAIYELQLSEVQIPSLIATSIVQSLVSKAAIMPAFSMLGSLDTVPVEAFQDLLLAYVESEKPHGPQIWPLIERWVRAHRSYPGAPLPTEINEFVHKMAKSWARSPYLRPRVAFRRVWECYRFLVEYNGTFYPSLSGAVMRAGVIDYIQGDRPLPKRNVKFALDLVESMEGPEVRQQADKMVFDYWQSFRESATRKDKQHFKREKYLAMQRLDNSTWTFRPYKPRFGRNPNRRRAKQLFEAGQAVDPEALEGYGLEHWNALPDVPTTSFAPSVARIPQPPAQVYVPFGQLSGMGPVSDEETAVYSSQSDSVAADVLVKPSQAETHQELSESTTPNQLSADEPGKDNVRPMAGERMTYTPRTASAIIDGETTFPPGMYGWTDTFLANSLPELKVEPIFQASQQRQAAFADLEGLALDVHDNPTALHATKAHPTDCSLAESSRDSNAAAEIRDFYRRPDSDVQDNDSSGTEPPPQSRSELIMKGDGLSRLPGRPSAISSSNRTQQSPKSGRKRFPQLRAHSPAVSATSESTNKKEATPAPPAVPIQKQLSANRVYHLVLDRNNRRADVRHQNYSRSKREALHLYTREKSKLQAREKHDQRSGTNPVLAILDSKRKLSPGKASVGEKRPTRILYLVRWKGQSIPSWHPWWEISAKAGLMVRNFHERYPDKPMAPRLRPATSNKPQP